ncbi:putative porin [Kangiella sp.]|uniref:putative porin n=1 Tax=Kangiella sp. TaxID=1920245 RepID=UPI0019CDCEC1|nr:putative porin [Kangiella sp.]MBD3652792.1 putative porin [Kangiella sp.]
MKLKLVTTAVLLSSAISVSAEEYTVLSDISWSNVDEAGSSYDVLGLEGTYYFDKKESLGPYNEFEYINKVSNINANYRNIDTGDDYYYGVAGELFTGNFLIGAGYSDNKADADATSFSLGYLFSDDFLVRVDAVDTDGADTVYNVSAAYNHQINATDYIGFTLVTDDEADNISLSSKYFTHLGDDRYLTASVKLADKDGDNTWAVGSSYYFTKATSVFASLAKDEVYEIGAQHFFNTNVALFASYTSADDADTDAYTIGLKAQF